MRLAASFIKSSRASVCLRQRMQTAEALRQAEVSREQLVGPNFWRSASLKEYGLLEMAEETLRTGKPQQRELFVATNFVKVVWPDTQLDASTRKRVPNSLALAGECPKEIRILSRLRQLGGRLDIESGKNGTMLRASVPLGSRQQ